MTNTSFTALNLKADLLERLHVRRFRVQSLILCPTRKLADHWAYVAVSRDRVRAALKKLSVGKQAAKRLRA